MLFGGQNSNTGAIKITCQEQKAKAQFKSDAATRPGLGFKTHMSVNLAIWPREQRPEGDAPPQQACPRWHHQEQKRGHASVSTMAAGAGAPAAADTALTAAAWSWSWSSGAGAPAAACLTWRWSSGCCLSCGCSCCCLPGLAMKLIYPHHFSKICIPLLSIDWVPGP